MNEQLPTHRPGWAAVLCRSAAVLTAGLALCGAAMAQKLTLKAELTGAQEVPPVTTPAMGTAFFLVDLDTDTVTYDITLDQLQGTETSAQIYGFAAQGLTGGLPLFDLGLGKHKTGQWTYTAADEANILAGMAYVNVQTSLNPTGEIRGQMLRIASPFSLLAKLDGVSEVPPVTTTAVGTGVFEIDPVANILSYQLTYADLSSAETEAHLHGYMPAGQNAPIVFDLGVGFHKVGTWNYPQVDEASILAGLLYSNVHSANFTSGEIRGQIEVQATNPGSYCTAKANSQACTPAIAWTSLPSVTGTDDFFVGATNMINNKVAVLAWSPASTNLPFMGGTLCVDQALAQNAVVTMSGGNPPPDDCSGAPSFHFSQAYMASVGLAAGSLAYAQWWYRDPAQLDATGFGSTDAAYFEVLN